MKKRLVSVVLVAAFAFSMLAGCGSDNSAANDNKTTHLQKQRRQLPKTVISTSL